MSAAPPALSPSPLYTTRSQSVSSTLIDTRIKNIRPLIPPSCLIEELPVPPSIESFIIRSRLAVDSIVQMKDDRLLVIVGPCSIHDIQAAEQYAEQLGRIKQQYEGELMICMRVYFEKPRTTVGWKGLINDPTLDGSYQINKGLRIARSLLLSINSSSVPIACEMLDTITPQFLSDLICWAAIGARTTESQLHRELVSGLSMSCGFKNGTTGSIKIAIDACIAARSPHCFLSVTTQGLAAIVETKGNENCHIVLRGSETGPNFSPSHIQQTKDELVKSRMKAAVLIDCSHGNSNKKQENQAEVVESVCKQVEEGEESIIGVMIESNLVAGAQKFTPGMKKEELVFGKSITDECVDFDTTVKLLDQLAAAVRKRREKKGKGEKNGQ